MSLVVTASSLDLVAARFYPHAQPQPPLVPQPSLKLTYRYRFQGLLLSAQALGTFHVDVAANGSNRIQPRCILIVEHICYGKANASSEYVATCEG